jgi:hypothetical protein
MAMKADLEMLARSVSRGGRHLVVLSLDVKGFPLRREPL